MFILPLRARDHFILYCEGELAGRQVRMARLLGEGPTSRPPQSPSCPPPPCLLLRRSPRGGSRCHVMAWSPRGTRWAQDASVSVGEGLTTHQATPCSITLGSAPRGAAFGGRAVSAWTPSGKEIPAPGASLRGRGSGRHRSLRTLLPADRGPRGSRRVPVARSRVSVSPAAGVDSLPGRPSILGAFAEGTSCPAQAGVWAPRAPEPPGRVCLSSLALRPALGPWVQPPVAVWPPLRPKAAPHFPRLGRGHSWFCPSPSHLVLPQEETWRTARRPWWNSRSSQKPKV